MEGSATVSCNCRLTDFKPGFMARNIKKRYTEGTMNAVLHKQAAASPWVVVYWCAVIAAFLGYTLLTGALGQGLVFLLVMGVLFGALLALLRMGMTKQRNGRRE